MANLFLFQLIKEFFSNRYFSEYHLKQKQYDDAVQKNEELKKALKGAEENKTLTDEIQKKINEADEQSKQATNLTVQEFLDATKLKLDAGKTKVDEVNTLLWTVTTALFVVGGMVGAFTSKYVAEYFGRKKGIIFHHIFNVLGAVLVFIAPYINSPECVIVSRFLYGVQGGMSCGLIPTYLSEISPSALRGATGVVHQLCVTIGILIAQTLGFRQILGIKSLWHVLLAIPIVPSIIGTICLLLFFPETPRALLINNRDEDSARIALQRLRNRENVSAEIDGINQESRETKSSEAISLKELFTLKELRWPLITGLIIQMAQQLCGINAVFFYSESIFRNANIKDEFIQYAVFSTGFINVIMTIVCVPLIDRLGRKPLLVYPMILIVVDFILLTVFLKLQSTNQIYSYLSIACIIVFIMCFAVGLGKLKTREILFFFK